MRFTPVDGDQIKMSSGKNYLSQRRKIPRNRGAGSVQKRVHQRLAPGDVRFNPTT
jgi:hypothetical protein